MFSLITTSVLLFGFTESKLNRRRPENDVGNLLISDDDSHEDYNQARLMMFFDMDCMESDTIQDKYSLKKMATEGASNSLTFSEMQETFIESMISNYYPCLEHSKDNKGNKLKHFQFDDKKWGISFLDVTDAKSYKDNSDSCLHDKSISLNYNDFCLHMATYEPYFELNGNKEFGSEWTKYTTVDCITQDNVQTLATWGLDATDSSSLDDTYTYPNTSIDNGVDLYIVDSGVRSSHIEFETGQVYGDEATYNEENDWYGSHGTHVAGIAGGINYGHSRHLPIYSYAVCVYGSNPTSSDDCPCWTSLIINALSEINSKLSNNSRRGVVNLSLGGSKTFFDYFYEYFFDEIKANGGIIVVAAGNEYQDACVTAPAWTDSAIAVGATTYIYTAASFSNFGDCVDTWAPGYLIYSSIADNDTAYEYLSGTSMASPAVAGDVANLLWVDPTLTHREILAILESRTTNITWYQCDSNYDCKQFIYDCNTLPSDYLNGTLAPTTTASNVTKVYYSGFKDMTCNYVGVATIDSKYSDSSNYNNYFISSTSYEITDKCLATQDSKNSYYSYLLSCVDDDKAIYYGYESDDCSGDGTVIREIESGTIYNNDWFHVDCNSKTETNENINSYDESDCDLVYRLWYTDNYYYEIDPLTGLNQTVCEYNETRSIYVDVGLIVGACYTSSYNGSQYSFEYGCVADSYITKQYYYGTECSGSVVYSEIDLQETCYGTAYVDMLECGNSIETYTDMPSTTDNDATDKAATLFFVSNCNYVIILSPLLLIILASNFVASIF